MELTMGTQKTFLYKPDYGERGADGFAAFDAGLDAADAELVLDQGHRLATGNVHGLTFTGPGSGGGLDADKVDGQDRVLTINADHTHQSTGAMGGQIDHGLALTGLADDDHAQYLNEVRHDTFTRHTSGSVDHGQVAGLADDDHTQYASLTWRSGDSFTDIITKSPWVDVRAYASINAAVAAIGATQTTLIIPNAQTLAASLTIPSTLSLVILKGGSIVNAPTYTLTINGSFIASLYQVFSGFSAGDVIFGAGSVDEIHYKWFNETQTSHPIATAAGSAAAIPVFSPKIQSATYIVYKKGSTYYAIASPETGLSDLSNTDFVDLMDAVMAIVGINGTNYNTGNKVVMREGLYFLTKTWTIPPTQNFELDCGSAVFTYTLNTGDMIVVDSFMNCTFRFGILNPGSGSGTSGKCVKIKPTTVGPDSLIIGTVSTFYFLALINSNGTALSVDATNGSVGPNFFYINELTDCQLGIELLSPPTDRWIHSNIFYLNGHSLVNGIQVGQSNTGRLARNEFNGTLSCNDSAGNIGVEVWDNRNIIRLSLARCSVSKNNIIFRSGASNNLFVGYIEDGLTDESGNTSNRIIPVSGISSKHNGWIVDRGDAAGSDWTVGDFTTDGTWRDLDCSSIVPAGAKFIHFRMVLRDDAVGSGFRLRKKGNSNAVNVFMQYTQVANVYITINEKVPCDSSRFVQYMGDNLTFDTINLTVIGWEF